MPWGGQSRARDAHVWALWFEGTATTQERVVARTTVGDAVVSTVFLALDHGWSETAAPILYETLVFGGSEDMRRYETREQALAGHDEIVRAEQQRQSKP
jgi:hypothetical protein